MLRILVACFIMLSTVAKADYNLIIPQKPSGGTSVWSQIVVQEWEKGRSNSHEEHFQWRRWYQARLCISDRLLLSLRREQGFECVYRRYPKWSISL